MTTINELIDRYVALWNEADPKRRRARIAELWASDGVHFTRSLEARGYDAIEARVSGAYEKFVAGEGYVFKPYGAADDHHNGVRLSWQMVPARGGEIAAIGTVFIVRGEDGRIRCDYQFNDPTPAA